MTETLIPTDEQLVEFFNENDWNYISPETFIDIARSVLECWGRPSIEPVPVSERPILKRDPFNDNQGRCWCGTKACIDRIGDVDVEIPPSWELREPCAQDDALLPHHALPVPATRSEEII